MLPQLVRVLTTLQSQPPSPLRARRQTKDARPNPSLLPTGEPSRVQPCRTATLGRAQSSRVQASLGRNNAPERGPPQQRAGPSIPTQPVPMATTLKIANDVAHPNPMPKPKPKHKNNPRSVGPNKTRSTGITGSAAKKPPPPICKPPIRKPPICKPAIVLCGKTLPP